MYNLIHEYVYITQQKSNFSFKDEFIGDIY